MELLTRLIDNFLTIHFASSLGIIIITIIIIEQTKITYVACLSIVYNCVIIGSVGSISRDDRDAL